MNAESLIFDIDGTLWDSRALVAEGYNLQLHEEGLDRLFTDAETLKSLFGKTMAAIGDALFPEIPAEERYALMQRCMDRENRYLEENPCHIGYPAVRETLETLSKKHRLFIVSNAQQGYPQLCIEKLGLQDLILGHLCFGDTGTEKGETIRTLMQKYSITSAAYIGDTEGDRQASEEAGLPFVWCAFGFGAPKSYDAKLDRFAQLTELFAD